MLKNPIRRSTLAVTAFSLISIGGAKAQLCLDIFSSDDRPILQCADADYFLAPIDGGFDASEIFVGSDVDPFDAEIDGTDIFDEPGTGVPDNIGEPFFARTTLSTTTDADGITTFTTSHRGRVEMAPRDSVFQSNAYQTRSRITFMPINMEDPGAPTTIKFELDYTLELSDPLDNAGSGAALGGFGIQFLGADDEPIEDPEFDFSALAELDLDPETDEPEFFGFDDPDIDDGVLEIDFEPAEPELDDTFDIDISLELEIDIDEDFDLDIDEAIVLEIDTFGSIFSDGFESGDVSAWTASSPDTFTFTISSPDPNVRFVLVPEPSAGALALLAGCGLIARRRR